MVANDQYLMCRPMIVEMSEKPGRGCYPYERNDEEGWRLVVHCDLC